MTEIKRLEMERMKYYMFLTIKRDILKMVKDKKLDDMVALLRRRKIVKQMITHQVLKKGVTLLFSNIENGRDRMLLRRHRQLMTFRIMIRIKNLLNRRFGRNRIPGTLCGRSSLKPCFVYASFAQRSTFEHRAKHLIVTVLRKRAQFFFFKMKVNKLFDIIIKLQQRIKAYINQNHAQQHNIKVALQECAEKMIEAFPKQDKNYKKS
jgi:hypothetical protein